MFRPEKEKGKGKPGGAAKGEVTKGKGQAGQKGAAEKPTKVQFLDDKRAQNIVIVLRKVNGKTSSAKELAQRLLALDLDNPLPADACELLLGMIPHLLGSGLEQYTGEMDRLRDLERDLYDLVRVPRLQPRLSVCLLAGQLDAIRTEAARKVSELARACSQVKSSLCLRDMPRYALRVGNFLNCGGDGPDEVRGITFASLLRLRHFRSGPDDLNALHGVAHHMCRDIPNFPQKLRAELEDVSKIGAGSLQVVRDGLAALELKSQELGNELQMKDAYEVDGDRRAVESLTRLAERTTAIIQDITQQFDQAMEEARSCLEFFGQPCCGELPRDDVVEEFFSSLVEIATCIQACSTDVENRAQENRSAPAGLKGSPREVPGRARTKEAEHRDKLAAVLRARAVACAGSEIS